MKQMKPKTTNDMAADMALYLLQFYAKKDKYQKIKDIKNINKREVKNDPRDR